MLEPWRTPFAGASRPQDLRGLKVQRRGRALSYVRGPPDVRTPARSGPGGGARSLRSPSESGDEMDIVRWIALGVAVLALLALVWWSAGLPDRGPGDKLARKSRESGGGWLGGGWGGGQ